MTRSAAGLAAALPVNRSGGLTPVTKPVLMAHSEVFHVTCAGRPGGYGVIGWPRAAWAMALSPKTLAHYFDIMPNAVQKIINSEQLEIRRTRTYALSAPWYEPRQLPPRHSVGYADLAKLPGFSAI
jgi:hypothetical protein